MGGMRHLNPAECFRVLGLPDAASPAEIKRAYRRMAQRFHPDKNRGDELARRHFDTISDAYRFLMRTARLVEKGTPLGTCCVCREFGEVVVGIDGRSRCPKCVLRPGGRLLLPMPVYTIASGAGAFVLLGVAIYLLLRATATGDIVYAAGAFAAGLGAIAAVAFVCFRVVYCIQPQEQARRRVAGQQRQTRGRL
jgi:hypothetical protein